MKYLILIIALCTLTFSDNYTIIIETKFESSLFDITEDFDGEISAVGFSNNFSSHPVSSEKYYDPFEYLSSLNSSSSQQIRLIKLNEAGDLTLDYKATLQNFNKAVSLIKTPENGYFVGGYMQNGQMILLKLDTNANPIFKKGVWNKKL